jgi:enoyl-CoA hydratase/carnithine racemase
MLTARTVNAQEAFEIGLVNSVFPDDQLMPEAMAMARRIASYQATAIRRSKQVLRHGMAADIGKVLTYEVEHFLASVRSEEHAAALSLLAAKLKRANP